MTNDWKDFFDVVNEKEYSKKLHSFLAEEYQNHTIYPPRELVYNAFNLTNPKDLKVVILGQDPYHNPGQAMGLSFSVPKGTALPPSLVNIYKEIQNDIGVSMDFANGDLTPWAKQGVLLLNAYLTVRENQPLSHRNAEYDSLLADTMRYLDTLKQPVVFLLWGNFAKKFAKFVKNPKHKVLSAAHPSPLSANRGGWFGKHNFSDCNLFLQENGIEPIDWKI